MIRYTKPDKWLFYLIGFVLLLTTKHASAWYQATDPVKPNFRSYNVPRYSEPNPMQYQLYYQQMLQFQQHLIERMKQINRAELAWQQLRFQQMMEDQRRQHEILLRRLKEERRIHQQFIRQFKHQKQEWLEKQRKKSLEQNKSGQKHFQQFFDDQRA